MMSFDNADGRRCGGMSAARREDGHALHSSGEGFNVTYHFFFFETKVYL